MEHVDLVAGFVESKIGVDCQYSRAKTDVQNPKIALLESLEFCGVRMGSMRDWAPERRLRRTKLW